MTVKRLPLFLAFAVASLIALQPAAAVSSPFFILLDLDNNPATGCAVNLPDTPSFAGIEQVLETTVTTTGGPSAGTVTGVSRQQCNGGVLTTSIPVSPGGWSVGIGNGTAATHVIETYFPLSVLAERPPFVRVFVAGFGSGPPGDVVVTTNGGAPIVIQLGGVVEIPTLSGLGVALFAVLLCGAAAFRLRKHRALLVLVLLLGSAAATYAAACVLDGQIGDWATEGPLATDPAGDGNAGADIRAFFGMHDASANRLCFRFDSTLSFK